MSTLYGSALSPDLKLTKTLKPVILSFLKKTSLNPKKTNKTLLFYYAFNKVYDKP